MRPLWPLAVAALLLCSIAAAAPAPSFFGDTGLILTPNALTADRHTALPHWHSMSGSIGEYSGNSSGNWDSAGVLLGLTERVELYLGYWSFDDQPFERDYGFEPEGHFVSHIKAQALREPDDWMNFAVGIRNMGLDNRSTDHEPTAYAVATKTVCGSEEEGNCLRLSFGMQFANEDDFLNEEYWPEPEGAENFDRDSLFGSAEWMMNRHITLMGEIQKAGDDEHVLNFGGRFSPCDQVTVDVFLIDDAAVDDFDLAIGASGRVPFDSDKIFSEGNRKVSHRHTAPSFFGDTGMILMPNAMTAPRHTATLVYHRVTGDIGSEGGGDIGDWDNVGVLVGTTDRLEVYAGLLGFDDDPFDSYDVWHQDDVVVHAKAQALREPDNWCNLAVGVRNVGLDELGDSDNEPSAYVVATKTICGDVDDKESDSFLRASVGLLLANEDGLLQEEYFPNEDGDDFEDDALFGGVEWMICKKLTLLGELIEVADNDHALNLGVRIQPFDKVVVDALLIDDVGQSEREFAWGVSYRRPF